MAKSNDGACLSDPNFAVICSFLDRYGEILGLPEVSCINLQNWVEDSKHVSKILADIHVRLLRRIKTNVTVDRWEKVLVKYCYTYSEVDAWEVERFGYKHSKLSTKLRVLKNLLESQFDYNTKFKDKINELAPDEMRFLPLGRDKNGLAYYYMLDKDVNLRVYRECQDDIDAESWEVVCKDRTELFKLITSLQGDISININREKEESPDTAEENKDCKARISEEKVSVEDVSIVQRDKKPLVKDIKVEPPDKDETEEDAGATTDMKNVSLAIKTEQKYPDSEVDGDKKEQIEKQENISNKLLKKKHKVKKVSHMESEDEKEHNEYQEKQGKEKLKFEKSSPGLSQGKEKSVVDLENELESDIRSNGGDGGRNKKCRDDEVVLSKNTDKGKEKQSSDVDGQEHDRTFQSMHLDFKADCEVKDKSAKGNDRNSEKKNSLNSNFVQKKENLNESAKILSAKESGVSIESERKTSGKELESKHKKRSVKNTKGLRETENEELSKSLDSLDKQNLKSGEKNVFVSIDLKDKTAEKHVSLTNDSKDEKGVSKCEENLIKAVLSDPKEKEINQSNEANKDNKNVLNSLLFEGGKGGNDSQKICDNGDGEPKTIGGNIDSNEEDKKSKSDSFDMMENKTGKDGVFDIKISVDKENKIQSECKKDEASPINLEFKRDNLERTVRKRRSASLISASVKSNVCQGSDAIDANASGAIDQSKGLNVEQSSQNLESNAALVCPKSDIEKSNWGSKCQEKAEEISSDKKQKVKEREVSVEDSKSKILESSQDIMKDSMADMQERDIASSNSTSVKYKENEGLKAVEANSLTNISKDSAPISKRSSKKVNIAISENSILSKDTVQNVNDSEKLPTEVEHVGSTQNAEDTHFTTSKKNNESVKCVQTNTEIEHDKVSAYKERPMEQTTDTQCKSVTVNVEEQSKDEVSGNSKEHNEASKSVDDGSKHSVTVNSRRNLRTRSKPKESKQNQDTSVEESTFSQGHENELSSDLKESKSEADETGKSKNKQSRKEIVDKTAGSKNATEIEKEQMGTAVDETEKDVEKRRRMKKANTEKDVEINSQEEAADKNMHEEEQAEKENNGREDISMYTERGKGGSSRGHISGASGGRKRQNWVDESAEESPIEPVNKKTRGRNHVTSRGQGKRPQRQVVSSSGDLSSTSSDDDVPLSALSKSGRGRRAMRGRGAALRGKGGNNQVPDIPTRKSSRPVKKKRFDSDEDSDSQTPVKGTKAKTASQKKEDEDQPKEEESVEETGCRRSARVRTLRARKKEKEPSPELDLIDDLDDSSYIAEESDDDDYVLAKRKGRRKNKCKMQEELIPKGRNAQRQEALSKGKKKEEEDDTPCCKCLKSQHPEWILLCDKCDAGYHTACLRPPLMIIPDGDWFCPPCEHEFLIQKLQANLDTLDIMLRKHDRLVKRRERLAFVGISLDNILKEETKENIEPEEEEEEEEEEECDNTKKQSSMKFRFGARSCRQHRNISYKFEEFDEMINTAIEEDMREPRPPKPPRLPKPPGISRGKDMANIFGPEHEDLEETPQPNSRKRKSKLTELDEEDFDDDSEDYEASEDIDSEATCEKDWESEEEVSDFSEEEFRPPRYATRKSNRHRKVDDDDDDCDSLEERSRRRATRSSTRRRNARHDILSDEEEMSTDEETEDLSDYWSSSQESSKKKSERAHLGKVKGKSKKKKRKIMSSENESKEEEEEEEEKDDETTKKRTKVKKSLRERDDDDSDYSESDYEERTYRRVSRRNINKRVNYRIMLGSESSSNSLKSASEKTESEGEEMEKINTTKSKKKNVIESDSDGTDDYYEEEKKAKKENNSAEESESVCEAIDKGNAVGQKKIKLLNSDTEEKEVENIDVSDKEEDVEKETCNIEKEEKASEVTLSKTSDLKEELKPTENRSPEQEGDSQDKQDSIVEEEKETGEIVEPKNGKEEENMPKRSPQESSSSLSVNDNSGNENTKVIDKKEDKIFSSKKPEAPVGVVKPEVRQGVIVENHQSVESCTPGTIPGQGYPMNYRMGSPNQGMRDPSMASPPIGSPPRHLRGQEQGFRHVSPSYSQTKGSMGGYMQSGFQTYHPQQQGPYTLGHSGPFPHGDPSRFYPQSSQRPMQQAPYSPSAGQPYMSHPNVGPHGPPYPDPYGPSMSNQGHHSSPSNYQGHSQGHYGPQGPLGPSYGGYPQGPHGSTHHPQGFHSPPQSHYQGPHPQGPYPLSQSQNPYPGSATGPYPYQHGNPKVVPHSQGPYPHPQSHSTSQHMSIMRPQIGPQGMKSPNFPPQENSFMQTDQGKSSTSKGTPEKGNGEKPPSKSAKGKSKKGEKKMVSSVQPLEPVRAPKRSGFMMDNILKPISTPEQGPFPTPAIQPEEDIDEIEDIVNYVANDEYFKEH